MNIEAIIQTISTYLTTYGLKVVAAVLILIAGWITAKIVRSATGKMLKRIKADDAIVSFMRSLAYILVITFTVIAALSKFGVQTASIVAILGAGAFAVGFALKDSLGDFAAGVLILALRPFKSGDYVEAAGTAGTVKEISLFNTVLVTPDNIKIMVPNGKIYGDTIKNISAYDTRRIDLVVGIGYGSSIERAMEVTLEVLQNEDRVLKDPAPMIAVSELADSSVNLVIRPWVKSADYWSTRFDLIRRIKNAFDQNDIEIPFPQRVIHTVASVE